MLLCHFIDGTRASADVGTCRDFGTNPLGILKDDFI
jgi:hypothetical protein